MKKISLLSFFACVCFFTSIAWPASEIDSIEKQVNNFEATAKSREIGEGKLKNAVKKLSDLKSRLAEMLEAETKQIEKITKDLASLGKPIEKEPADVAKKRKELESAKKEFEQRSSTIRLLALRAEDSHKLYTDRLTEILKNKLMARTPDIGELLKKGLAQPGHWIDGLKKVIKQPVGVDQKRRQYILYIIAFSVLVLGLSVFVRKKVLAWANQHKWGEYFSDHIASALLVTSLRWLPHILVSGIIALGFYLVSDKSLAHPSYYLLLIYALPALFGFLALVEFLLVPHAPAVQFLVEDKKLARSMAARLRLFVLMLFIAFILFSSSMRNALSDEMFFFARGVFAVFFMAMLISLSRALGRIPALDRLSWLRLLFILSVIVAILAELSGYRNLSTTIFRISIGVLLVFGALKFLWTLFSDIYTGLESGEKEWQKKLRSAMGIRAGSTVSWLPWIRFLTGMLLWIGFLYVLLFVLGLSEATLQQIMDGVRKGFSVGSLKVVPERIFWAIVAFSLLYLVSSWLKARFEKHLKASRRVERGAREAMVTMVGYVGAALAIIVALGISGFTFTNLAIIAGALSVGIGFGLQNIVNNFVSGLILLFERPVKTGDWVVVGNTEGYVKKIRIRSTQIQTFDRADVIVPNSDLISNQVTNWMLYDQRGRARVPVGVAYGSDTQKVKEILTNIAVEHSEVIHNNDDYPLRVLFLGFGDSSLNFELRCFVRNIDKRLQVVSDLNFAIDQAFRENGIEIPFPQRDVHIKGQKPADLPGENKDDE